MTNKLVSILIIFCAITVFVGCGEQYFFEEKITLDQNGWMYKDSVNFVVDVEDTTKVYSLLLDIGHSKEYSNQNLYLYINTQFPNGKRLGKRLSIDLAENSGKWYGECGGSSCNLRVNLQSRTFFNQHGKHTFTVKQYMRKNPLQGVESLSLKIKDLGEQRK